MKCCHYERHLTNISGTFYSDQFILAKTQLFSLSFLYIEEESPPPISTPWAAYRSATSCGAVPLSMVVGHILMVHTCSLMWTNHIDICEGSKYNMMVNKIRWLVGI